MIVEQSNFEQFTPTPFYIHYKKVISCNNLENFVPETCFLFDYISYKLCHIAFLSLWRDLNYIGGIVRGFVSPAVNINGSLINVIEFLDNTFIISHV
jgi:hypothetical protein